MPFLVGLLQIELFIPASQSLKEKRFVLSSLKSRLSNKFNISVAEVDHNDKWQRATLGIALVGNERRFLDQSVAQIMKLIYDEVDVQVLQQQFEVI
ncbi:MAG TPA: DUF503 domain-containing protein [bacterium]|nr:DUF503 domain-containing protein [bacterium]HNT66133.1 DUF503 domain-containing protein [bacterium]HOX87061.1 DUF503 domain-containing protein [bacterium]HPG46392.1 DUF503 domain-containing protein [bacterium]HPM98694.1 DUF503 domain-containing protein [bacterium]